MRLPPLWPEHLPKSLPPNTITLGVRILTYEFGGRDTDIQCIALHLSSYGVLYIHTGTSLVAQIVKNLPAMQETQVPSLGWEYLLEKEMATHSSILAGETPWTEKTGGYSPWGRRELDTTERLITHNIHTALLLSQFPAPHHSTFFIMFPYQFLLPPSHCPSFHFLSVTACLATVLWKRGRDIQPNASDCYTALCFKCITSKWWKMGICQTVVSPINIHLYFGFL